MTAYDYHGQRWVHGDRARRVRLAQVEGEIALLSGHNARVYAQSVGLPSISQALASLRREWRRLASAGYGQTVKAHSRARGPVARGRKASEFEPQKWRGPMSALDSMTDVKLKQLQTERDELLEACRAFPRAGQHNLCSTATREERSEYIRRVMSWGNSVRELVARIDAAAAPVMTVADPNVLNWLDPDGSLQAAGLMQAPGEEG